MKRIFMLLVVVSSLIFVPLSAQTTEEQIASKNEEAAQISAQIDDIELEIEQTKVEILDVEAQKEDKQKEIDEVKIEIETTKIEIEQLENNIKALEEEIQIKKDVADNSLIAAQMLSKNNYVLASLSNGEDLSDYYNSMIVVSTLNNNILTLVDSYQEIQQEKEEVENKKANLEIMNENLISDKEYIEQVEVELNQKKSELEQKENELDSKADEVKQTLAELNEQLRIEKIGMSTKNAYVTDSNKTSYMNQAGISASEQPYADYIIYNESGWNYRATNSISGSYGLCQALPPSKMASSGSDWQTNPVTQLKWCNGYAKSRYGSWQNAYNFWYSNHWW